MIRRTCSCIIPFYNEGSRVLRVLEQVVKVKEIDEIICVDDGSTDEDVSLIKKDYPTIKLISLEKNYGKSAAIEKAASIANSYYILLLDADLKHLNHRELSQAITKIKANDYVDMLVLRRINAPFIVKLHRGDVLVPGERILKRKDLLKIFNSLKPIGFQIEFAINKYMVDNGKKVYWMPSSATNFRPTHKHGFIKGMFKIIFMTIDILKYLGVKNYVYHWLYFCREELVTK